MKITGIATAFKDHLRTGTVAFLVVGLAVTGLLACSAPTPTPTPSPSPQPTTTPPVTTPSPTPTPTPTTPPPPPRYTLSTAVNPSGSGSISPSSGTYDGGTQVTLRATPNTGWTFDRWSGDVSGNTTSVPLTLNSNKSVTANFARIKYTLTVNVTPQDSGSVGPIGGTYDYGSLVTLVAKPAAGYEFDRWGGDASGNSASVNVTMESNKNITAYFKSLYQTITRNMPAGSAALNTISFSNEFKAGDRLQGFVELTGDYHPEDVTYTWSFVVTGPQGIIIENWQGNIVSSQRHDFDKTIQYPGRYLIQVSHTSRWARTMTIKIMPGGWQG